MGNGSSIAVGGSGIQTEETGVGGGVIVSGGVSVSPVLVEQPVINKKYYKPEMAEVGVTQMDPRSLIPSRGSPLPQTKNSSMSPMKMGRNKRFSHQQEAVTPTTRQNVLSKSPKR